MASAAEVVPALVPEPAAEKDTTGCGWRNFAWKRNWLMPSTCPDIAGIEKRLRAETHRQEEEQAAGGARTEELQALEKELAELPMEPAPVHSRIAGVPQLPEELAGDEEAEEAIAKAKLSAKAPSCAQPGRPAPDAAAETTEGPMELDEEATAELVDTLLDTLDSGGAPVDASGGGTNKRYEVKRQLASAVARGLVKKKPKCG